MAATAEDIFFAVNKKLTKTRTAARKMDGDPYVGQRGEILLAGTRTK